MSGAHAQIALHPGRRLPAVLDRRALISLGLLMAEAARRLVQIEHQLRQDLCSLQGFICALATAFGGAGNGLGLIVDCMHLRQLGLHALTQLAKAALHRFHFVLDARQGCGGFIGTRHAALRRFLATAHAAHAVQGLLAHAGQGGGDLFGRLRRALRQVAYFICHHREAAAAVAGTGGFDRSVQGQQVGLFGDGVDRHR